MPPTLVAPKSPAQAVKEVSPFERIMTDPRTIQAISKVADKALRPERLLQLARLTATQKGSKLAECRPGSIVGSLVTLAGLGLEPNTPEQLAFLIPRKSRQKVNNQWVDVWECNPFVSARGYVDLLYRQPAVKSVKAEAIFEGDDFDHEYGTNTYLSFKKNLKKDRGEVIGAFCFVQLEDGQAFDVMTWSDIVRTRARSDTYRTLAAAVESASSDADRAKAQTKLDETPWVLWEDQMAAKSAIRRLIKQLKLSKTLAAAAALDDALESGSLTIDQMANASVAKSVFDGEFDPDQPVQSEEEEQPAQTSQTEQSALAHEPGVTLDTTLRTDAREAVQSGDPREEPPPPSDPAATGSSPRRRLSE